MDTLKLIFTHPSAAKADKAEVTLDRFDANDFTIRKDSKDGGSKDFRLTFRSLSFSKSLYKPVEMEAAFILSDAEGRQLPSHAELCGYFRECSVSLLHVVEMPGETPKSEGILQNGIVTEVKPVYGAHASVTMRISSPDYRLTLDKYCRAYTGKRFFKDVVVPQLEKDPWNIGVAYGKDGSGAMQTTNLRVLGYNDTKEAIQPYMVQYNESFYDFIARVAHRCGEFMYFENGMLHIGLPWDKVSQGGKQSAEGSIANPKTLTLEDYKSVTYLDKRVRDENVQAKDFHWNTTTLNRTAEEIQAAVPDYAYDSPFGQGWAMEKRVKDSMATVDDRMATGWKGLVMDTVSSALNRESIGASITQLGAKWGLAYANAATDTKIFNMLHNDGFVNKSELWTAEDKDRNDEQRDEKKNYLYEVSTDPSKMPSDGNKQAHYGPFSNIADDDKGRFLYFETGFYAAIAAAENFCSANIIKVNLGTHYKDLFLGDVVKLGSDRPLYVITNVSRVTTPVSYYVKKKAASQMVSSDTRQELVTRDRIDYVVEMVPLLTADNLKSLPAGGNLRCNVNGGSYAVFPPLREESDYRISSPQRAFIAGNDDPCLRGMVAIRYPWQKGSDDPSPWIRMTTGYAGSGNIFGGMYFRPDIGTEVLVDYVGGNVEQPYVIGNLFNKTVNQPGESLSLGDAHTHAITSRNHHGIYFNDPDNYFNALGSLSPIINTVNKFGNTFALVKPINDTNSDNKYWVGGISLRDRFGIYNISMSSDKRNITISSPVGDVKVNALTGIEISAPCGNVTIEGKNVNFKAGNRLEVSSGENIDREFWEHVWMNNFKEIGKALVGELAGMLKLVDMSLVRTVYECVVKPIDGTFSISSKRYMFLNAGMNDVRDYAKEAAESEKLREGNRFASRFRNVH
ncbi:MAG: hypothetical protein HUK06_07070, partial [Bacteroidaceae bacterium]|nr:hypothetical protein [Bacteroidaceae bacterium]